MIIPFIKNINFFEFAKFMSLQKKSVLPKEYQSVEYLESSGIQYIITPFTYDFGAGASSQDKYDVSIKCSSNDNYSICGARWNDDRAFNLTGDNNIYKFYAYSNSSSVTTDIPIEQIPHTWEYHNYSLYCDGALLGEAGRQSPGGGLRNIYLFARNYSNSPNDIGGTVRIYSFAVKRNDTPICDMYPCIRKSDNKPGMYDLITQQFFTNSGTGEFETPIQGYLFGKPPFTFNSNGNPLVDYTISGNTAQSGTPTPDNPIMPEGTGERTGNLYSGTDISGSTALPYEPYGYKIPISSAGQTTPVYLGKVETTRKIKKLVLTGEEVIFRDREREGSWRFFTDRLISVEGSTAICTHFENIGTNGVNNSDNIGFSIFNNAQFGCRCPKSIAATASDFKSYLAAQYAAGTPVTVWYVLATEETGIVNEPLMKIGDYADTVSKAQAGVEIPTINGSNTLTVDTTLQPSEVSIVYKK